MNLEPTLHLCAEGVGDGDSPAARWVMTLMRKGIGALVANAAAQPALLRYGSRELPVTIDNGELGHSYVSSPHSAYALYARDEIEILRLHRWRSPALAMLGAVDRLLRVIRINRAVHLDNWLLSTNLHGDWHGEGLPAMRELLCQRFPDHFIILRSLDRWSCPELLAAARDDGWIMVPSRQIWVTDDLERDWRTRNAYGNDRRALVRSGLRVEEPGELSEADAERIADLYHQLYVGRYSALNPVFTARFMQVTARSGQIRYQVARDTNGRIMAVAGMLVRGDILTVPVLGYDTGRPQGEALYRIAAFLYSQWAMERGLRLHNSSGAGEFKRNRGARGEIEYMAIYARHLSRGRPVGLAAFARLLETAMVPLMRRQGW